MSALCNEPFGCFEQKGYSQGFCECYKSPLLCIATFFCPCIVVGKVAGEMVGNDFALVPCLCAPLGTFRNRRLNVDRSNGESETVDASMMAVTCCHCCA